MQHKELSLFVFLTAVFVAALVAANVLAAKIISVGGVFVPGGVLAYSITFAVTDTVCEVWGQRRGQTMVVGGFLALFLVWGLVMLGIALPPAPFWKNQAAFEAVLNATLRITIGSLVAFAISQTFDVWIFHRLRRMTEARWLWLRNNVSTIASQTLDTVIFVTIAFYGEFPILPLIAGQLVVKYAIALADTPVVYGLVYLVRARLGGQVSPETA